MITFRDVQILFLLPCWEILGKKSKSCFVVDENRMSFNWLYRQRTTEFIQTLWSIFFYLFKILLNCKNSLITNEVDEKHIISLNWLKKKRKRERMIKLKCPFTFDMHTRIYFDKNQQREWEISRKSETRPNVMCGI